MQARVSRRVDALGLPAAVCCSSGRDGTSAPVCWSSAGSVLVCVSCPVLLLILCCSGFLSNVAVCLHRINTERYKETARTLRPFFVRHVSEVLPLLHYLSVPSFISLLLLFGLLYSIGKSATDGLA